MLNWLRPKIGYFGVLLMIVAGVWGINTPPDNIPAIALLLTGGLLAILQMQIGFTPRKKT
ncbi:MAG: hypothetical protein A2744_00360 [Candidatus Buchananbacteria bacterium RIFCSPHIGHO2_01_FULL_44_11]|uniref:Uncharacterized protein n=1 Tax=Candidatus Buchananbacteria bacterium RIFCSPHIGHO2_01_FULL_44_11 TaxID=1797535 RepID=A0A1G1XZH1_9BACT|nr:MAG: hypothetical protein A2744_00360 [Candidatus Buchananbacteria bacterium RIFCSPHIGHO2_01_FULL_44_11]